MADDGLRAVVLAKIKITDDQELHVRERSLDGVPDFLELAQFNTQGGGYRLACPWPDDDRVLASLIRSLQRIRDQRHGAA